jgi:hypothetical protein
VKKYSFTFIALVLFAFEAAAMLSPQRLSYMAMNAERKNYKPALPFISSLLLEMDAPSHFVRADGEVIYSRPTQVVSSYYYLDPTGDINDFTYQVGKFYKPKRPRFNMVIHYGGLMRGSFLSFGVDSGYAAEKINIKPAFFIGYTQAFTFNENDNIVIAGGAWFGGEVAERPCLDDYDRTYWCRTLTAWSDRPRQDNDLTQYIHVAYSHHF